ncbi:hypothetical protein [Hydrogenimonas sp. SS33]|uniref:hypothetical protein n=1 Tax=Hydrogenimonas leucolamina TaxID=2954236 RepID=UPI00336BEDC0
MCETLKTYLRHVMKPQLEALEKQMEAEGNEETLSSVRELIQTFGEIVSDIESEAMDEWECGELYEEFKRYKESGDLSSLV